MGQSPVEATSAHHHFVLSDGRGDVPDERDTSKHTGENEGEQVVGRESAEEEEREDEAHSSDNEDCIESQASEIDEELNDWHVRGFVVFRKVGPRKWAYRHRKAIMDDFMLLMRSVTQHRDFKRKSLEEAALPYHAAKRRLLDRARGLDMKGFIVDDIGSAW